MKIISDDPIVAFITLFFLVTAIIATVLYDIGKNRMRRQPKLSHWLRKKEYSYLCLLFLLLSYKKM